ncbi:MAG: HAD family phosphatase [Bacilli bacterium]|nr:HAD family phosphatase [Bacilli bacterium]
MIKNIIFDIGGVLFDDKNNNLKEKFNLSEERTKEITNITFGNNFSECMLGKISVSEYLEDMKKRYPDIKEELEYLLDSKDYPETFPLKKDVYDIVVNLYKKGYNLYILSNNTKDSFSYVSSNMDMNIFKGIVSSYQEHLIKPDEAIYNLIVDRYNLKKEETIFFDDNSKNVLKGNELGIKSIKFNSIEDIINNI